MPSQFGGIAVDEAPSSGSQFGGIPVEENQAQQNPSFLGGMWENFKNAGQSASDLLSGNYSDFGNNPEGPKTAALADKLFPPGYQGGAMEAFNNLRHNVSPNDVFGALNEKFGASPEGKALSVIGGVVPEFNAVSTAINQDVNPFLEKHTGIGPETLQTMELGLPALAGARTIAGGGEFPETPSVQMAKNAIQPRIASLMADESGTPNVLPTFTPQEIKQVAVSRLENAGNLPGQIPMENMRNTVNGLLSDKNFSAPTERTANLTGSNEAIDFLSNLKNTLEQSDEPWTPAEADKIDNFLRGKLEGQYGTSLGRQYKIIKSALKNAYQQYADSNPQEAGGFNEWLGGDKLYSAAMNGQELADMVTKAQGKAVPATSIKTAFNNFVSDESNKIGLTDGEWEAAQYAAKHGIVTGALKGLGSRIGGQIAGAIGGMAIGSTMGPYGEGAGALIGRGLGEAVAAPFRYAANARQTGRAQRVIDMISQRPAVQQALNPNYTPPAAAAPSTPLSANPTPALLGGAMEQRQPATAPLSDQNMQELQKVQQSLPPQSNVQPAPKPTASTQANNFFAKEAKAESSNNPNAQSKTSSASGLFGFTNRTWADMVRRYGKQTGINLGDKNNPQAQATMARLLAQDNIKSLQTSLGRMPTKPEVYYAHVFGAEGADKLIKAAPDKQAIMLFPRNVIDANHSLFFEKGKPRTVGEVEQILARKVA